MDKTRAERDEHVTGVKALVNNCNDHKPAERLNYTQKLSIIEDAVKLMYVTDKMSPIFVIGAKETGKTVLANFLKERGSNVELINVEKARRMGIVSPSKLIIDRDTTYLFDDATGDLDLYEKADKHAKSGGLIVLFTNSVTDIDEVFQFNNKPKCFILTHCIIKEIIN